MKNFWNKLKNIVDTSKKEETKEEKNDISERKIDLREGTAEFELFMAKAELTTGHDLAHGAMHLANLLNYDPTNEVALDMAEQYLKLGGNDPLNKLFHKEEKRYISTEALKAWILYKTGKLEEAIELLIEVNQADSSKYYLKIWGLEWISPAGQLESLSESCATILFSTILTQFGEADYSEFKNLQLVRRWADLLDRIPYQSPQWTMVRIGLLRKSGRLEEALQLAGKTEDAQNWHHAVAIGLALRRLRRLEEAEKAFMKAMEFDPQDISSRLEAGDSWFENDYWEKALRWYDEATQMESDNEWALATKFFCKWKITGDEEWINDVIKMAKEGNSRAHYLWFLAYGAMPEPYDASANVLRQVSENIQEKPNEEHNGEIKLTVSSLEAPSNSLAFRLEMERLQCHVTLKLIVENIPTPDPRIPSEPVKWLLWKYEGIDATPALPAPSKDVEKAISELAQQPYYPYDNWSAASLVAAKLGKEKVAEILAVAVCPPPAPQHLSALNWLPRIQLCVAQVLATIDTGWDDSTRKEALLSMLFGPSDWTVTAAIKAMSWIAQNEEMYQLPIHECFLRLEKTIPADGYCCWAETLYAQWLNFPFLFDSEKKEFEEKLNRLSQE